MIHTDFENHLKGEPDFNYEKLMFGNRVNFQKFSNTEELTKKILIHNLDKIRQSKRFSLDKYEYEYVQHYLYYRMISPISKCFRKKDQNQNLRNISSSIPHNIYDWYQLNDKFYLKTHTSKTLSDDMLDGILDQEEKDAIQNIISENEKDCCFDFIKKKENETDYWLDKIQKKGRDKGIPYMENAMDAIFVRLGIDDFMHSLACDLEFESFVPKSKYLLVIEAIETIIQILAVKYNVEYPEYFYNRLKISPNPNAISEAEIEDLSDFPGIELKDNLLVISNYEFKDDWIFPRSSEFLISGICFRNCSFAIPSLQIKSHQEYLLFLNCQFKESTMLDVAYGCELGSCFIYNDLTIKGIAQEGTSNFWIHDCFFDEKSNLIIKELAFAQHYSEEVNIYKRVDDPDWQKDKIDSLTEVEKAHSITLNKNIFWGNLVFLNVGNKIENIMRKLEPNQHTELSYNINLHDILINGELKIDGFRFGRFSTFKNIIFPLVPSTNNSNSRRCLYDTMKRFGFEEQAKMLNILFSEAKKKNNKFDMDAYQVAYSSGFLNPDQAAFCISKSKVYLAKKRQNDRKKVTQKSLPFIISGKDIQYPVEALLAFKVGDWNRLKELRQKYPIPKDSD